jgi:hypothetical protein
VQQLAAGRILLFSEKVRERTFEADEFLVPLRERADGDERKP